jgi:hypothetical protein
LLTSIEKETQTSTISLPEIESIAEDLDPWTQSLIGVIKNDRETDRDAYIDYLEEKYS